MKRLTWIDVAKGLGILLVVLAHTRFPTKEMSWWINSFHMPLFFVVAGLCYDESRYPSLLTYLKRKCVALVYPYFTLSFLVIGLVWALYWGPDAAWTPLPMLKNMLRGSPGGAFWFITVLLQVEIFYAAFSQCVRMPGVRIATLLLLSFLAAYLIPDHLPYFFDTGLVALFFYGLGHFCRPHLQKMLVSPRVDLWFAGVFVVAVIIDLVLLIGVYRYKATFAARDLKAPAFYFLLAALGTAILLMVSIAWDRVAAARTGWLGACMRWGNGAIRFLARNTVVILAFHNFLGLCRSSWHISGLVSQILEFLLLGLLLWLLSGPLHFIISPPLKSWR